MSVQRLQALMCRMNDAQPYYSKASKLARLAGLNADMHYRYLRGEGLERHWLFFRHLGIYRMPVLTLCEKFWDMRQADVLGKDGY